MRHVASLELLWEEERERRKGAGLPPLEGEEPSTQESERLRRTVLPTPPERVRALCLSHPSISNVSQSLTPQCVFPFVARRLYSVSLCSFFVRSFSLIFLFSTFFFSCLGPL